MKEIHLEYEDLLKIFQQQSHPIEHPSCKKHKHKRIDSSTNNTKKDNYKNKSISICHKKSHIIKVYTKIKKKVGIIDVNNKLNSVPCDNYYLL